MENVAGWSGFVSGPESAAIDIAADGQVNIAYTDSGDNPPGADLFYGYTLGTPLGVPLAIPVTYDFGATGASGGPWTLDEGGNRVLVNSNGVTQTRMVLSFDLSSLPAGVAVVGAELDVQQFGAVNDIGETTPVRGVAYGFADDGVADGGDANLGPGHLPIGILDPVSATSTEEEVLSVLRLEPQAVAALVASNASHLGVVLAPQGTYNNGAFTTSEAAAGPTNTFWIAPRLWLYYRLPGDATLDGQVDADDLARITENFGLAAGATIADGDIDGDQDVDGGDLLFWQRYNGTSAVAVTVGVPEPAASLLLLIAVTFCSTLGTQSPGRNRFG